MDPRDYPRQDELEEWRAAAHAQALAFDGGHADCPPSQQRIERLVAYESLYDWPMENAQSAEAYLRRGSFMDVGRRRWRAQFLDSHAALLTFRMKALGFLLVRDVLDVLCMMTSEALRLPR